MSMKEMGYGLALTGLIGTLGMASFASEEYFDAPIFMSEKTEQGRTKNSIAAIVAGIVGQKLYGNSTIDLEVQKTMFPNARVTGHTTSKEIDTHVELLMTSSHFTAENKAGALEGKVSKSELDWDVKQTGSNTYVVSRWGPKFNTTLVLNVENGKIIGSYCRPLAFDWTINGTYDSNGRLHIDITAPFTLGITLDGNVKRM